jgi:hypothetical protein
MGLLDRFKTQPRWKHADPAVRAMGVQDLQDEEHDLLVALARTDPDPRVRRAAVSRLGNVAVLTDVVRRESDAQVRDEASGVLLDIALGAYEADEAASLAAVEGLTALPAADAQKQLVLVAKTARRQAVSRRALDRLRDEPRALGTTARRAESAETRLAALARLADVQELTATALKSDYKDVALAAVERITEPQALRSVAARAKNPAAQRRARALLRGLEEQGAAAAEAEMKRLAAVEERRRAQRDLCRDVEALVASSDWHRAGLLLDAAEERWRSVGEDADPELARRFGAAVAAVRDGLTLHEAERAAGEQLAAERAGKVARREALLARVSALPAAEVAAALPGIRADWQALTPLPGGDDLGLIARFEAACRAAEARAREAEMVEEQLQRLEALSAEAETLAGDPDVMKRPEGRGQLKRLRDEWRTIGEPLQADERVAPLAARWAAVEGTIQAREQEMREARAREERDALARAIHAADAADRIVATPDATLKTLDRVLRDAREALGTLEHLPHSPDRDAVRQRLEAARTSLGPRVQELRDADEWQRWANASVQEQLIAKAEALRAVEDPADAARQLRDLQEEWKKVAAGPRDQGQALWRRFKTAIDEVRGRTDAFFEAQAQARSENLQRKLALCQRAEALAESTDWIATADAIKALQAEWKTIGPGPRKDEQAAWERFRTACDRFFTRRHEDLAQRKHAWSENLAKKEALCLRAETLAEATDWEAAAAELKRLQSEWKTIGPVRKNKSEVIWQRFRTACDRFFERYKQRHILDLNVRLAAREALIAEALALSAPPAPAGAGPGAEQQTVDAASTVAGATGEADAPRLTAEGDAGRANSDADAAPPVETQTAAATVQAPAPPTQTPVQIPAPIDRVAAVRSLRARWANAPVLPRDVLAPIMQRFEAALAGAVGADPDAVRGTEFDVAANLRRLQELVSRAEQLAGPEPARRDAVSPAAILATQLREALAANTIGGRADDESKVRAAEQEIRQLQTAWSQVGFVPDAQARPLALRFQRACQRFFDQREQRRRALAGKA